jgi:hypothetical protein
MQLQVSQQSFAPQNPQPQHNMNLAVHANTPILPAQAVGYLTHGSDHYLVPQLVAGHQGYSMDSQFNEPPYGITSTETQPTGNFQSGRYSLISHGWVARM